MRFELLHVYLVVFWMRKQLLVFDGVMDLVIHRDNPTSLEFSGNVLLLFG